MYVWLNPTNLIRLEGLARLLNAWIMVSAYSNTDLIWFINWTLICMPCKHAFGAHVYAVLLPYIYIYMHMHIFIKILLQLDPWLGTLCVNLLTLLPQSWSDGYTYIFIHDMWQFILIWLLGFLICLLANYACTPYVYVIQFSVIVYSVHIIIHPYAYWCSTLMWKEGVYQLTSPYTYIMYTSIC